MYDDLLDEEPARRGGDELAIGIDLGTTNSVVAVVTAAGPTVLAGPRGERLLESVVAWLPNGERRVGAEAARRRLVDPKNTIASAKRIIGQTFGSAGVQEAIRQLPYEVVEGHNQEPLIVTREGRLAVAQVSSYVLGHLKAVAEAALGRPVTQCVVTVPANFSDGQRAATRQAAQLAGLEVLRILNEPTAAALAYGHERGGDRRLAVFDLGGGTFDVTLLEVHDHVFEVVATGGDPFLGGDDFDRLLADHLAAGFLRGHRVDLASDPGTRARLVAAAVQIKAQLSEDPEVEGEIEDLAFGPGGKPLPLPFAVDRRTFDGLIAPLVDRAMAVTERVLGEARLAASQIDEVILVGGSTRVPCIRDRVAAMFGKRPRVEIDPMEVVAMGAAVQARALSAPESPGPSGQRAGVLLDVLPHSLRMATAGGFSRALIAKNSPIPAEGVGRFATTKDDQATVRIAVCQGEAELVADNIPVGEVVLDGLPPGRRGDVVVEVAFTIDADGMLQVSAREPSTGRQTHAQLTSVGLSGPR